jgi:hypothetical protein
VLAAFIFDCGDMLETRHVPTFRDYDIKTDRMMIVIKMPLGDVPLE